MLPEGSVEAEKAVTPPSEMVPSAAWEVKRKERGQL